MTTALRAGKGSDALLALQGMLARSQTARQGTVQRWVRDCDSIGDSGLRVRLLHAVLRAGKPIEGVEAGEGGASAEVSAAAGASAGADGDSPDNEEEEEEDDDDDDDDDGGGGAMQNEGKSEYGGKAGAEGADDALGSASVVYLPAWSPGEPAAQPGEAGAQPEAACASRMRLASDLALRVVMTERGPERQPPNNYDLHIWAYAEIAVYIVSRRGLHRISARWALRRRALFP